MNWWQASLYVGYLVLIFYYNRIINISPCMWFKSSLCSVLFRQLQSHPVLIAWPAAVKIHYMAESLHSSSDCLHTLQARTNRWATSRISWSSAWWYTVCEPTHDTQVTPLTASRCMSVKLLKINNLKKEKEKQEDSQFWQELSNRPVVNP